MSEIALDIRIRPGIEPMARHEIEDALEGKGFDVAGGGGHVDGAESDIMIFVSDVPAALPEVVGILWQANVGPESVVLQTEPANFEHRVYSAEPASTGTSNSGATQSGIKTPSRKPWWKFW